MDHFEPGCAGNPDTYRTGSTNPPKSYRGVVAVLLILVILLISIVTVLGMMNIHLFRMLEQQAESSVHFSDNGIAVANDTTVPPEGVYIASFGFTGEEIESVYRSYNQWPNGLYISAVEPNSPADAADIRLGDILIAVDGHPIAGKDDFQKKLDALHPDHPVHLTVFRENDKITIPLTPISP